MTVDEILRMALPNGITLIAEKEGNGCPKCDGYGHIFFNRDGVITCKDCECLIAERNRKRLDRSGLSSLITLYTFASYQDLEPWQSTAKDKAVRYVIEGKGKWFYICGTPGSGKTHICTAIMGEFLKSNKECRYMLWRKDAPRLKALVNDRESYESQMERLKTVDVLYIDDFLKGTITDADINLAFELLNERYNNKLMTVMSGERSISEIMGIDEAVGSRIYEMTKEFRIKTPEGANWRLK